MYQPKERLYRTARINAGSSAIPAGLHDGQFVAVRAFELDYNGEWSYLVSSTVHIDGLRAPIMPARLLDNFCL